MFYSPPPTFVVPPFPLLRPRPEWINKFNFSCHIHSVPWRPANLMSHVLFLWNKQGYHARPYIFCGFRQKVLLHGLKYWWSGKLFALYIYKATRKLFASTFAVISYPDLCRRFGNVEMWDLPSAWPWEIWVREYVCRSLVVSWLLNKF